MKQSTKVILRIASISSLVLSILCIAVAIGIFFEMPQLKGIFDEVYILIYDEYNASMVKDLMNSYALYGVFSAISNILAARTYWIMTRLPIIVASGRKEIAIFSCISQFIFSFVVLFPISLLPPIIAAIGLITFKVKYEKPIVRVVRVGDGKELDLQELTNNFDIDLQNQNENMMPLENVGSPEMIKIMSDKLNELRRSHNSGECSDQEFAKRLNDIISYKWN